MIVLLQSQLNEASLRCYNGVPRQQKLQCSIHTWMCEGTPRGWGVRARVVQTSQGYITPFGCQMAFKPSANSWPCLSDQLASFAYQNSVEWVMLRRILIPSKTPNGWIFSCSSIGASSKLSCQCALSQDASEIPPQCPA
eukprot:1566764-Amphidinium_carterae.1